MPTVTLARASQQALAHERLHEDPKPAPKFAKDPKRQAPAREEKPATIVSDAGAAADHIATGIAKGVGKALDAVANIFESILAPPTPERQIAVQKEAARQTTTRAQKAEGAPANTSPKELISDSDRQRRRMEGQLKGDLEPARKRERTRER